MIHVNLTIRNPWSDRFKIIWLKAGSTFIANKFYEVQVSKTSDIASLIAELTTRQSHSGFSLHLALIGFELSFRIYDQRHWDYYNQRWEDYEQLERQVQEQPPQTKR